MLGLHALERARIQFGLALENPASAKRSMESIDGMPPMINAFAKLLVFQFLGEGIVLLASLPVPGPVTGMLLMLFWLFMKDHEAESIAPACSALLSHLALFFIPAAVGIMLHLQRVADEWFPIAAALITSTIVSAIVTAVVIRQLSK